MTKPTNCAWSSSDGIVLAGPLGDCTGARFGRPKPPPPPPPPPPSTLISRKTMTPTRPMPPPTAGMPTPMPEPRRSSTWSVPAPRRHRTGAGYPLPPLQHRLGLRHLGHELAVGSTDLRLDDDRRAADVQRPRCCGDGAVLDGAEEVGL